MMDQSLEDRFRVMLVSALAVDHPDSRSDLRDLAEALAREAAIHFRELTTSVDAYYWVTSADGEACWRSVMRPFSELLWDGPEPPARRPVFLGSQDEQESLEAALDAALATSRPSQRIPLTRIREQLRAPWLRAVR